MVTTGTSRWRAAATSTAPGSLTVGVPASVTRATSFPAPSRWRMRRSAESGECAWKLTSSAPEPTCASRTLVCRASSAATAAACFRVAAARGERSSRLPSGVATTYKVPAISPRHLPRQAPVEPGRLQHVAVLAGRLAQDLGRGAGHHDLHPLEQLQRPVHQGVCELLGLHHGIRRFGAARGREDRDRLVLPHDGPSLLLRGPLRPAWACCRRCAGAAPVPGAGGGGQRVRRLRRRVGGGREHYGGDGGWRAGRAD